MGTETVSLNTVLEYVGKLDIEDQHYLLEILHRRIINAKRMAIVRRAKQAKANMQKHKSRSGTAKDLLADDLAPGTMNSIFKHAQLRD